jgi:hypothetical protein
LNQTFQVIFHRHGRGHLLYLSYGSFTGGKPTSFLTVSKRTDIGIDRERLSAFDKVSSLGLIAHGIIALAEAFGVLNTNCWWCRR